MTRLYGLLPAALRINPVVRIRRDSAAAIASERTSSFSSRTFAETDRTRLICIKNGATKPHVHL